jgi:hypothetical protein
MQGVINDAGVSAAGKARLRPYTFAGLSGRSYLAVKRDFDSGRVTKRAREIERPLIQIIG